MCNAVKFEYQEQDYTANIDHPSPTLPVLLADESTRIYPWGRHSDQPGNLPFGYTVRRDVVLSGRFDKWFPRRVLIPFQAYMLMNFENQPKWYPNDMKQYLVGLLAKDGNERRIYLVINEPDIIMADYHTVMPCISSRRYRSTHR